MVDQLGGRDKMLQVIENGHSASRDYWPSITVLGT